jgi:chromosomal replication initiator protein
MTVASIKQADIAPIPLPSRHVGPIAHIQILVALSYNIAPEHMKSRYQGRNVTWPRQVAMFLARERTHHSLPAIGLYFGNRNHATVVHAIKIVKKRMASDPLYRADVEALRAALS